MVRRPFGRPSKILRAADVGSAEETTARTEIVLQIQVSSTALTEQLNKLADSHDDIEKHSRRNNLIFYGILEEDNETWAMSEKKVLQLCDTVLGIKLDNSHVERVHRLGRFRAEKCGPIIVNLSSFKTKRSILSLTS